MAESRLARELENRTENERPKSWQPPSLLPEPDKQPGYAYRWVRTELLSSPDPRNVSAKMREGWEPVRLEEQPKFKYYMSPKNDGPFKDNIEVAGLLLCKIPEEFIQQHYLPLRFEFS